MAIRTLGSARDQWEEFQKRKGIGKPMEKTSSTALTAKQQWAEFEKRKGVGKEPTRAQYDAEIKARAEAQVLKRGKQYGGDRFDEQLIRQQGQQGVEVANESPLDFVDRMSLSLRKTNQEKIRLLQNENPDANIRITEDDRIVIGAKDEQGNYKEALVDPIGWTREI